jgi:hypothetical protein
MAILLEIEGGDIGHCLTMMALLLAGGTKCLCRWEKIVDVGIRATELGW